MRRSRNFGSLLRYFRCIWWWLWQMCHNNLSVIVIDTIANVTDNDCRFHIRLSTWWTWCAGVVWQHTLLIVWRHFVLIFYTLSSCIILGSLKARNWLLNFGFLSLLSTALNLIYLKFCTFVLMNTDSFYPRLENVQKISP